MQPGNGVKFALHTVAPDTPRWEQQQNVFGTFDWKPVAFSTRVPKDATEAWLVLGLEATTGQVWFDDIKITMTSLPLSRPTQPAPRWNNNMPHLRGAMINSNVSAEDLRVLGKQWGANHVRWQLLWGGFPRSPADDTASLEEYDKWLDSALKHLDELLPVCKEAGLLVLIDLHTPPGGRNTANQCRIFHEKKWQDKFLQVWDKIAQRYRGNTTVWGYDLVNEPVEGTVSDGLKNWHDLAEQTAKRVRALDAQHAIIVEPAPWGASIGLKDFEPLDVPNVVYSVHMYEPLQVTHQGVANSPVGFSYPSTINGKLWDKDQLRKVLQPVIDFQRDYGAPIYIGEFSAIRWAPDDSAYRYMKDLIDIFEENNWSWAYHAFREWHGWSVEHGTNKDDNERSVTQTNREQLLRTWFAKNLKPVASKTNVPPAKKS
jgi:endoglucanase